MPGAEVLSRDAVKCPVSKHLLFRMAGAAEIEIRCTCRRLLLVHSDGTVEVLRDH